MSLYQTKNNKLCFVCLWTLFSYSRRRHASTHPYHPYPYCTPQKPPILTTSTITHPYLMFCQLLPPAHVVWEGNVFRHVCLSVNLSNSRGSHVTFLWCTGDPPEGPAGYHPEWPAGKDCWTDLGRRAWVPPGSTSWDELLVGPGKEGLGTPPKDQLGRTAGRAWEGGPRYHPRRTSWVPPGRTSWVQLASG